ncbi:MAG TPA: hypothetical protein VLR94_09690 [Acidobacteriota bacterium]|nr:hypothetical protein [Acidobacteriota bacterium]
MTSDTTLLNEVLPRFDVNAEYSTSVHATPARVYAILQQGMPAGAITKLLMTLRNLPRFFRREESFRNTPENAFYKLKQLENREMVVGIIGQFWKPISNPLPIHSLEEFLEFEKEGYCKAAMNLRILEKGPYLCVVTTETRVLCYGSARAKFLDYWKVIGPFSGLIRKELLRRIKKRAERR